MSAISASFRGLSQQSHLLRGWSFTGQEVVDLTALWTPVLHMAYHHATQTNLLIKDHSGVEGIVSPQIS